MERKNQIIKAGLEYQDSLDEFERYHTYPKWAFIDGAKWADEHPDSKHTYTKQQLIDMGFAFTTNGDIVTPDQLNEDLKNYLKYQKQKFIEQTKEWLQKTIDDDVLVKCGSVIKCMDVNEFVLYFCKAMEE